VRPGGPRDPEIRVPGGFKARDPEVLETRRSRRPGGTPARDPEVRETRRSHRPGGRSDPGAQETKRSLRPGGSRDPGVHENPEVTRPGGQRDPEVHSCAREAREPACADPEAIRERLKGGTSSPDRRSPLDVVHVAQVHRKDHVPVAVAGSRLPPVRRGAPPKRAPELRPASGGRITEPATTGAGGRPGTPVAPRRRGI
jgi:hypothetical protein